MIQLLPHMLDLHEPGACHANVLEQVCATPNDLSAISSVLVILHCKGHCGAKPTESLRAPRHTLSQLGSARLPSLLLHVGKVLLAIKILVYSFCLPAGNMKGRIAPSLQQGEPSCIPRLENCQERR